MLRPLLLVSLIFLCPAAAYSTGIIGTGGSASAEFVGQLPEVKVDQATYNRIMERLSEQERIQATFRGENMELVNIRIEGRDNIVESQLRLKITRQQSN